MENEFWINVEVLSLGGNISLLVIPRRKHFEILLDDQELGRIYRDKDEKWQDMDETLPANASQAIGLAIEECVFGPVSFFRIAG
ncbi:hypothetical protein WG906_01405 [Pedobacter sp. P351]|uniref:hypothetical protein n=1 Tax=Pedobacter superstes TaxID=3133441 RepID=UPI0030B22FE0